jgi:hypothetical protein
LVLTPPIRLDSNYFPVKEPFNKVLKIGKSLKHFGFVAKQIDPSKFTEVINEANIVIVSAKGTWGRTPYIRKNKI